MGTLDLYAADFPHGSPAGFDAGCRSGPVCNNFGSDEYLTCKEAIAFYNSDYTAQKRPRTSRIARPGPTDAKPRTGPVTKPRTGVKADSLMAPLGVHTKPKAPPTPRPATPAAPVEPAAPIPSEPFVGNEELTVAATSTTTSAAAVSAPAPAAPTRPARAPGGIPFTDPRFPHGTTGGYQRGCGRGTDDSCPGDPTGKTCKQARAEYQANYMSKKSQTSIESESTRADTEHSAEDKPVVRETEVAEPSRDGGEQGPETVATPEPSLLPQSASDSIEPTETWIPEIDDDIEQLLAGGGPELPSVEGTVPATDSPRPPTPTASTREKRITALEDHVTALLADALATKNRHTAAQAEFESQVLSLRNQLGSEQEALSLARFTIRDLTAQLDNTGPSGATGSTAETVSLPAAGGTTVTITVTTRSL